MPLFCLKSFGCQGVALTCRRLAAAAGLLLAVQAVSAAEPEIEYNKHIRPILAENCFPCHGPDSAARKADLRLDKRETAVEMAAIVPNDPSASELIVRIFSDDPTALMPPAKTGKQLTPAQRDLLKRWVASGAEYQKHWSFIAPQRAPVPPVKNSAWVRNPIDSFVLAELEKRGLAPAPEADRRTLARRLSLDLVGLPPEPADVEAFVNDRSDNAYEKFVDRLMQSEHWGEQRGRYWLDAARYADTHGIHFDNFREMWSFRDWVIGAFNRNMPFDQFTLEQLAGDLLPNKTLEQQIASGFNRCNMTTNEGGVIPEEYLVFYTRDRTETTSQVWLGLTAGCAVCHDHKFDPLSQREFYELAAFFNNNTQRALDGNVKDTPPIVNVAPPADRERFADLEAELGKLKPPLDARKKEIRPEFDAWVANASPQIATALIPTDGLRLYAPLSEGKGETLTAIVDGKPHVAKIASGAGWKPGQVAAQAFECTLGGSAMEIPDAGDFDTNHPFSYGAWVRVTGEIPAGAVFSRRDDQNARRGWDLWFENGRIGAHLVNEANGSELEIISRDEVRRGTWNHLFVTYDGSGKAAGLKLYVNGAPRQTDARLDRLSGTIRTNVPFVLGQRNKSDRLNGLVAQDLRVYGRELTPDEVQCLAGSTRAAYLLATQGEKKEGERRDSTTELFDWWLPAFDDAYRAMAASIAPVQRARDEIAARGTIAHVMNERTDEAMAYILFRGEYDKRRDAVKADTPDILPAMAEGVPKNRLGLAQWLLRPDNPLPARVTVNRFWQELFGTGLVKTAGDFGVSGEIPSHPELLDWMAVEFRESNWDVKRFFKLLVTSATYRQSALATPEKIEKDPQNRLLSRGPRFRMDGEMVRDYALAASGLLVPRIGGPSVKPYQPPGVWEAVAMNVSNTHSYVQDHGDRLYRRSLYTFWKRAAPPALMEIFNAPNRETCTVRRERTNTPLQALATLNDITFVEAARNLAQRSLKEGGATDDAKLQFTAGRLLSRPLRDDELKVARAALGHLLAFYRDHPQDAAKLIVVGESKPDATLDARTLAAWTMLANELLNLDEVLNK